MQKDFLKEVEKNGPQQKKISSQEDPKIKFL